MIDYDVETTGLQPYAGNQRPFLFQFGDDSGDVVVFENTPENREEIQRWLNRAKDEGIRAHNAKFDRAFGEQDGYDLPGDGCWHDSMVVAHAVDERRSVALNAIAEKLGLTDNANQKAVRQWLIEERARRKKAASEANEEMVQPNFSDVPMDIMEPYAKEDIILTREISAQQDPIVANSADLKAIVEFERPVLDALYAVEKRGFPADPEAYHRLELEVIESLEAVEDEVKALASAGLSDEELEGFEFNPGSPQQVYKALKRLGADMSFVTGTSMDKENLATVEHELARAIERFRAEAKTLSTYVRPMVHRHWDKTMMMWKEPFISPADSRVHANYRQVGARTGRMSCSDPNMQNQPRDDLRLRYNFVADPGFKLVSVDLDAVEMAIFAAYTGEGRLLNVIREGGDPHALTAEMLGITDRKRAGGYVESARQRGKTFNFSVIYGGGKNTIRKQQRCSTADAELLKQRYYKAYPEVKDLQSRIESRLYQNGYIKSAWGRRYRCNDPRKEAYKFVNYLVQGTAADLLKASLVRLHHEGVPIVACVHDELIAHVPAQDAEEAKQAMIAAMVEHPRITEKVPLRAEGAIVDRWSDAKPLKDGSLFKPRWAQG